MHIFNEILKKLKPFLNRVLNYGNKLQRCHENAYAWVLNQPLKTQICVFMGLLLVYAVVIIPVAVWIIDMMVQFSVQTFLWGPWQGHFIRLKVDLDYLRICGQVAQCSTSSHLDYILQFFKLLCSKWDYACSHLLYAPFLSLSAYYCTCLFLSLIRKLPQIHWAPGYTVLVNLGAYVLMLYLLGLPSDAEPHVFWCLLIMAPMFAITLALWLKCHYAHGQVYAYIKIFISCLIVMSVVLYLCPELRSLSVQFSQSLGLALVKLSSLVVRFFRMFQPRNQNQHFTNGFWSWTWSKKEKETKKERTPNPYEPIKTSSNPSCDREFREKSMRNDSALRSGEVSPRTHEQTRESIATDTRNCHKSSDAWSILTRQTQQKRQQEELEIAEHNRRIRSINNDSGVDRGGIVNTIFNVIDRFLGRGGGGNQ